MEGRICVVTGANRGIGKAMALGLAERGATVVMMCRNEVSGAAAAAEITNLTRNDDVRLLQVDLSSQESIRRAANVFRAEYGKLHVLINSAAVLDNERTLTVDGIENQFAVNHLAYFFLTHLLLDVIRASAPARIINVTSGAHYGVELDLDDLECEKEYDGVHAYNLSKLANIYFTYELARRLNGSGVTVNCFNPGVIATGLLAAWYRQPPDYFETTGHKYAGPEKGAETGIYLASSPEVDAVTGRYFVDKREDRSSNVSYDEETAARLWEISADLTGLSMS